MTKFRGYLSSIKGRILGDIAAKNSRKIDENIAINLLLSLNPKTFFPLTSFTLLPSVLLRVLNDIVIEDRKNILEFGCGISTLYMALLIKKNKLQTKITSVESDPKWLEIIRKILIDNECENFVTLIHSEVVPITELNYKNSKWYNPKKLDSIIDENKKYDLVIVDGPYGKICPYARYAAVPFIKNNLSESFSIYLDDADRKDEIEIAKEWSEILNTSIINFNRTCLISNGTYRTDSFFN